jgi:hypothetical protein
LRRVRPAAQAKGQRKAPGWPLDRVHSLFDDVGRHGEVGLEKTAREVNAQRLAGGEIEQHRARGAAERRAIVGNESVVDALDRFAPVSTGTLRNFAARLRGHRR